MKAPMAASPEIVAKLHEAQRRDDAKRTRLHAAPRARREVLARTLERADELIGMFMQLYRGDADATTEHMIMALDFAKMPRDSEAVRALILLIEVEDLVMLSLGNAWPVSITDLARFHPGHRLELTKAGRELIEQMLASERSPTEPRPDKDPAVVPSEGAAR